MGNKTVVFYCHSGQMTTVNTGSIAKNLTSKLVCKKHGRGHGYNTTWDMVTLQFLKN